MKKILIITHRRDDHGSVVYEALKIKGANPILWYPEEYLANQQSSHIILENGFERILTKSDKKEIDLVNLDVVWYRRPRFPRITTDLDEQDAKFVQFENQMHMKSLWQSIGRNAKWVNPYQSCDSSNCKAHQLRTAAQFGFKIPHTLISNDRNVVHDFITKNESENAETIYKTFMPGIWNEDERVYQFYTTKIKKETITEEDILRLTPGIFQKYIPKAYEIRATFMAEDYIAVKIDNQNEVDWSTTIRDSSFKISAFLLPKDIEDKCIQYMKHLNLHFAIFDFIVTPRGDVIFLEINEMGQFLWIENVCPEICILDMFCNFLLKDEKLNPNHVFSNITRLKDVCQILDGAITD